MHQTPCAPPTTIQQEQPEQEGIEASWEGALTDQGGVRKKIKDIMSKLFLRTNVMD
jgi:hypothetical protein